MKRLFLIASFVFIFGNLVCSQSPSTSPGQLWTEVYDEKLGISLSFPAGFIVDNEPQKDWFIAPVLASLPKLMNISEKPNLFGLEKSVSMFLRVNSLSQTSQAKDYLWYYLSATSNNSSFQNFKSNRHDGRIVYLDTDKKLGTHIVMAVGSKIITLTVYAKKEDVELYERILGSLKIDGRELLKSNHSIGGKIDKRLSLSELQTSPEVIEALQRKPKKIEYLPPKNISELTAIDDADYKFSRPLIILRQPTKFIPPRDEKLDGVVKAKVEFLRDGTVGDVLLYGEMPKSFARKLFSDLREMKFLPAEKDGAKVDFTRIMVFDFTKR